MQNFAADMKGLGKESLANEVAAAQDEAALVFVDYGNDWIILPDKRNGSLETLRTSRLSKVASDRLQVSAVRRLQRKRGRMRWGSRFTCRKHPIAKRFRYQQLAELRSRKSS
jgi:hypothetical protein